MTTRGKTNQGRVQVGGIVIFDDQARPAPRKPVAPPKPARYPWTAREITKALCRFNAPFAYNQNHVCVPNLSHSMLDWEADLIVCSKKGFLTEVEIKISAADWKADSLKYKWQPNLRHQRADGRSRGWDLIKEFWYVAPCELAIRYKEMGIPNDTGVMSIGWGTLGRGHEPQIWFDTIRPAQALAGHRPLTPDQMMNLARLASMRVWTQPDPIVPTEPIVED